MTENKEREHEREKENKKNGSSQNIERETQNDTLKKNMSTYMKLGNVSPIDTYKKQICNEVTQ